MSKIIELNENGIHWLSYIVSDFDQMRLKGIPSSNFLTEHTHCQSHTHYTHSRTDQCGLLKREKKS